MCCSKINNTYFSWRKNKSFWSHFAYIQPAENLATTRFSSFRFPWCHWCSLGCSSAIATIHRHSADKKNISRNEVCTTSVRVYMIFNKRLRSINLFLISRAIVINASSTLIEFFALVSKNCTPSSSANAYAYHSWDPVANWTMNTCKDVNEAYYHLGLGLCYCSLVL